MNLTFEPFHVPAWVQMIFIALCACLFLMNWLAVILYILDKAMQVKDGDLLRGNSGVGRQSHAPAAKHALEF